MISILSSSGFPPGMSETGGSKGVGGLGFLSQKKKIQSFKFWCLKWSILTEIFDSKIWNIFLFYLPTRGKHPPPPCDPPCGAEWGDLYPPSPAGNHEFIIRSTNLAYVYNHKIWRYKLA